MEATLPSADVTSKMQQLAVEQIVQNGVSAEGLSRSGAIEQHPNNKKQQPLASLPSATLLSIATYFAGARELHQVRDIAYDILAKEGFTPENTLLGNSTCPDEINSINQWNHLMLHENFSLGGLTGLPFVGRTGFGAFSHHACDDGRLLVLYSPHVGIDRDGRVGKLLRHGQSGVSAACGSAIAAYGSCVAGKGFEGEGDYQQKVVYETVKSSLPRLKEVDSPMAELPYVVYEKIRQELLDIIRASDFSGPIALLGGIQINTSEGMPDYFLVKDFEVTSQQLKQVKALTGQLASRFSS
eukprot:jgi/Chlat1/8217/Chrsp76S00614